MKNLEEIIASELKVNSVYVKNVIGLIDEGNTIPFIARYRKEMHGSMDDTTLRKLDERLKYLRSLNERRETIKKSIEEQGKLTSELSQKIDEAETLAVLEDLYRPYKPKKRTRAIIAKEKGLEPLADKIMLQENTDILLFAKDFIDSEKDVNTVEDALNGAKDIIAENISDDASFRELLRRFVKNNGFITSKQSKDEDSVYRLYYSFSQPISKMLGYQVLAINRGEKEGFLKVSVTLDDQRAKKLLSDKLLLKMSSSAKYIEEAIYDSFDRLIMPSLEREFRSTLTEQANNGAIDNFALNLKPLLMQRPVKGKVTMGLDPGYTHGCKVAVIDETGKVLDTTVVYPTFGERQKEEAITKLSAFINKYNVEHLAIGNGTASRETESMASEMLERLKKGSYAIVNEAGASVYSASKLAAEEFPEYDVNLRSAVSIARRLQDPLAELVKIEPMAIGVGQYQHDMPQKQLEESLIGVVEDCVNTVGVDINTASPSLLSRVAGLNSTIAKNIVKYREEKGAFKSRTEIKKVPKLGPKAFEQCAGFLKVPESKEVLDNTFVHPESYKSAEILLSECGFTKSDIKNKKIEDLTESVNKIGLDALAKKCNVGPETLKDIVRELQKPGRDPREDLPEVILRKDVLSMSDLKEGLVLKGTVRNVIDFGAFVDIGVHQDGLVHISQICDKFIHHPSEVLSVGDIVDVKVLSVDEAKHKIALSMKNIH